MNALEQDDRFDFIDKLTGRCIKIIGFQIEHKFDYMLTFSSIKKNQILSHMTHLVDYCETN